ADTVARSGAIELFIAQWNETAHPFAWKPTSFEKILAKVEAALTKDDKPLQEAA
ncbi:MAG: hypothetical protein H0T39_08115, partial [Actinobacteria bacterium]|nr:hypothetical protein [Actinomycetota bacterium]